MTEVARVPLMPTSLEQVDEAWLTQALSIRFPGTVVTSAIAGSSIRATATKLRLLLEYNDAGHAHRLPPTMYFKTGLEPHSDYVRTSHAREGFFYEHIAPLKLLNCPSAYFTGTDENGFSGQLIEDLLQRNARFGSALEPVSVEIAGQTLEMLARLHAHWWRAPELEQLGAPGGSLATDGIVLRLLTPEAWDEAMARGVADAIPAELRDIARVRAGMEKLWALDRASDALCMVHGDAHPGNMFFEQDGKPGFLDYQRVMQCDWAHDVNYFMLSSMAVADSAAHEQDLLKRYLAAREALGVPAMSFDEAWLSYRRHTMYGLVWNVVIPGMQTLEVVEAISERFNAAAARHGLVDLLNI
jgi:hypothetical protein